MMENGKNWMIALCCMLFIISAAVVVTLNFRPLYYADIDWLHIEEESGYSQDVIRENYDVLIDYNSMFFEGELEFPTFTMSESGKIHFEEVKVIFVFFQKLLIVTGILSVAAVILRWKRDRRFLKWTAILTLAVPAAVGLLIAANWEAVFVTFHKICFRNDYWIFDPATDPVITILPDAYFMHCAIMIIGLIILASAVCGLIYHASCRHEEGRRTK